MVGMVFEVARDVPGMPDATDRTYGYSPGPTVL
jgi:hypothetical protein